MSDDLVERLREEATADTSTCSFLTEEAASRIEKLETLVEQLRDDNSSLIDDFDKTFLDQESRIEKLESALREIATRCDVSRLPGCDRNGQWAADTARKALEGKDE